MEMDIEYKQVVSRVTAALVGGIVAQHFADADDDLIEFACAFFTPECAADARQIIGAAYEYVS
jgi:hypothetical protein